MAATTCHQTNSHNFLCGAPAAFGVYWVQTGEDETLACALHLAKAVRAQAGYRNETTFKVRVIKN
jgi:hypothetical protein